MRSVRVGRTTKLSQTVAARPRMDAIAAPESAFAEIKLCQISSDNCLIRLSCKPEPHISMRRAAAQQTSWRLHNPLLTYVSYRISSAAPANAQYSSLAVSHLCEAQVIPTRVACARRATKLPIG